MQIKLNKRLQLFEYIGEKMILYRIPKYLYIGQNFRGLKLKLNGCKGANFETCTERSTPN